MSGLGFAEDIHFVALFLFKVLPYFFDLLLLLDFNVEFIIILLNFWRSCSRMILFFIWLHEVVLENWLGGMAGLLRTGFGARRFDFCSSSLTVRVLLDHPRISLDFDELWLTISEQHQV